MATRNLTKRYGKSRGVSDINLQVEEGEIFGFIGPNGAGKSTTIRMLMQLAYPTSGEIMLFGSKVEGEMPELRKRIGYLPSEINLYKDMTGRQLLEWAARAHGLELSRTDAAAYAELLQYDMDKTVKSYSLGNRKKLGIILSLLHRPKLLILDEPTSGLDPLVQHAFFDLLKQLNAEGMTVFFSTHVLNEVEKVCDRVAIIREGSIIRTSRIDEISGGSKRTYTVQFTEPGDRTEAYGLRELDPDVRYEAGVHTFTSRRSIHDTLQAISRYDIRDITIQKPTLEELFMDYYRKDRGDGK